MYAQMLASFPDKLWRRDFSQQLWGKLISPWV